MTNRSVFATEYAEERECDFEHEIFLTVADTRSVSFLQA